MEKVEKKSFKDYVNKADIETCVICQMDFKDDEEIAELNCNDKHIFHSECIKEWLTHQMICPTCRKPVSV